MSKTNESLQYRRIKSNSIVSITGSIKDVQQFDLLTM